MIVIWIGRRIIGGSSMTIRAVEVITKFLAFLKSSILSFPPDAIFQMEIGVPFQRKRTKCPEQRGEFVVQNCT
jgi:hypothetical protein